MDQVIHEPGGQGDPNPPNPDDAGTGALPTEMEGGESDQQQQPQQSVEELLAELENTRAALKKANDEAASRRIELKRLQDERKAAERAEMDELDRLKAELADLTGAAEARDALQQQVEALEAAVTAQVDALMKSLKVPGHVKKLLERMTPAEKLSYLAENQKHFAPTAAPSKPNIDGQGGGGQPPKRQELDEERKKALRRRFRLG